MAQHAVLTKKSNQRIAAAVAVSGLVGTGLAFPFAQVALGATTTEVVGNTCTITSDGSSSTVLRTEIEEAIADTRCTVIVVDGEDENSVLDLEVEGTSLYVGPINDGATEDPRTSMTIRSTTGLNVYPTGGFTGTLVRLEDREFWSDSADDGYNDLEKITIEGLAFRNSETSAIDGLGFGSNLSAILEVKNSRFTENGSAMTVGGGAILTSAEVFVSNSIFIDNYANRGGALRVLDHLWIDQSLFISNQAVDVGGAVYAENAYAGNSTFVDSSATEGGAIVTECIIELVQNTFDDNVSVREASSAYSYNCNARAWGNIFSNDEVYVGVQFDSDVSNGEKDWGYNIFTESNAFSIPSSIIDATREELAFDEFDENEILALKELSAPVTFAPVLGISSSSRAAGFVEGEFPSNEFRDYFDDKISVDQLGTPRTLPFAAGAHQVSVRRSSGGTAPVVVAPVVPKEAMVPGFAANSTKLTKPMKKEIRQFLKANPNLKNVVCKGYTSSPSTPQDRTLARKRGKATCDYILTLRPDAQVTIRSGSHTNKPGSQIRRVEIKLS
jgi:hypothetical protein